MTQKVCRTKKIAVVTAVLINFGLSNVPYNYDYNVIEKNTAIKYYKKQSMNMMKIGIKEASASTAIGPYPQFHF